MKLVKTSALVGDERLARDVSTKSGVVLIPTGSILRKDYIEKLIELGVFSVWIEEKAGAGEVYGKSDLISLERLIKKDCEEQIKSTMEKFYISQSDELSEVKKIAENIISEVLSSPQVLLNITGMRSKSEALYVHSVNVCIMSVIFAVKLKLTKRLTRMIAVGSLLHDIGLKYVDAKYANYAGDFEELTKENTETDVANRDALQVIKKEYKKHVIYGYDTVKNESWIEQEAKDIILYHHERLDGSGYPMHLTGKNLDIGTRIVAVSDEFDNLIYMNKMKVHQAIERVIAGAGRQFDFEVVKVFNESVAAYPNGTKIITTDGETGVVLKQNLKCPSRPVIKIFKNKDGVEVEPYERDMTKELSLFIEDTFD